MKDSDYLKVRVAIPVGHTEQVKEAMFEAGAGVQGRYDHCSGTLQQMGQFRPLEGSSPHKGSVGSLTEAEEELVEILCHKDKLKQVIAAIRHSHPYEEPAIDILRRVEIDA